MNYLYLICFLLLVSCQNESPQTIYVTKSIHIKDTVYLSVPKINWQEEFGLTHNPQKDTISGKAVSFYLNKPNCSGIAKDFYFGRYKPTDDFTTPELLDLALTEDKELRPFYLWCLNKTILIADGALGEYIGAPALNFAKKYPKEFFQNMDYKNSHQLYQKWIEGIRYSGLFDFFKKDGVIDCIKVKKDIEKEMLKNCHQCSASEKVRIQLFYEDILRTGSVSNYTTIYFDTIPIIGSKYLACLEYHDNDDVRISLVKIVKSEMEIVIPKFDCIGGFFDTILVQDYNFDGIEDIDFVYRPGCISGANTFHNIYLKQSAKFSKASIPKYSFLSPAKQEKIIYGMYNGTCDFELVKLNWQKDSLVVHEIIDIRCLKDDSKYKAIAYKISQGTKIKTSEKKLEKLPENYTKIIEKLPLYH